MFQLYGKSLRNLFRKKNLCFCWYISVYSAWTCMDCGRELFILKALVQIHILERHGDLASKKADNFMFYYDVFC